MKALSSLEKERCIDSKNIKKNKVNFWIVNTLTCASGQIT